jgi:NCS1 family nucleobase:cation symporter-1
MICDYYIVRRGYLDIKAIYSASKTDPYYYTYGFSWRAYASYLAGILINIVGFAGAVGRDVPIGAQYIYNINYFTGVLVSGGVYWLLTKFFPVPATSEVWNEVDIDVDEYNVEYGQEVGDEEHYYGGRRSITDDQKGLSAAAKKV